MTVTRPVLRTALLVALVASVVAQPRALGAGTEAERVRDARAHYEQAVAHYNLDEFAPALSEFREAYRLKPDPSFLFNIAQCHRKLGENQAALDFYRKYLRSLPGASNRAEVERMVAELRARESSAAAAAAATTPAAPTPAAPTPELAAQPPSVPTTSPLLQTPAPAPGGDVVRQAPGATARPLYQRWWFWVAVGAAVAVGGIAGYAASRSPEPYAGTLGPHVVDLGMK